MTTPSASVVGVLELGKILHATPDPEAVRKAEQSAVKHLEADRRTKGVLGFNDGAPLDVLVVRIIAYVAHSQLATTRAQLAVPDIVRCLGSTNAVSVLKVRQAISRLLVLRRLVLVHEASEVVRLGPLMLDWFSGGSSAVPVVASEARLRTEWRKGERRADARRAADRAAAPCTAKELARRISEHVVGLDAQVRTMAVRLTLHQRRAELIKAGADPGTANEALLLIGASGSGKTFLSECAGRVCGLPFGISSATDLTCSGYVGLSVDDVIKRLILAAGKDYEAARYGLCFVDEISSKASSSSGFGSRDVAGVSVQQEFLRLMEGTEFVVGGRQSHSDWAPTVFNSRGTCFIFAGAFVGLEKHVKEQSAIGFGTDPMVRWTESALYDGLISYGMIPEWLNRLSGVIVIPTPTAAQLIQIAERCVLPSFNRLLAGSGAEIRLDQGALRAMADLALRTGTFARGVKSLVSRLIEDAVFDERKGLIRYTEKQVVEAAAAIGLAAGAG